MQPIFPRSASIENFLDWRIDATRQVAQTIQTINASAFARQLITQEAADRALRDVYEDFFLRSCQYALGIQKGSATSILGALYHEECLETDLLTIRANRGVRKNPRVTEARERLPSVSTIEHVVPVGLVRMHYFQDPGTKPRDPVKQANLIDQEDFLRAALCPVALITNETEKTLNRSKVTVTTLWPSMPFARYAHNACVGGKGPSIRTFEQKSISAATWTWDDHWCLVLRVHALRPLFAMNRAIFATWCPKQATDWSETVVAAGQ